MTAQYSSTFCTHPRLDAASRSSKKLTDLRLAQYRFIFNFPLVQAEDIGHLRKHTFYLSLSHFVLSNQGIPAATHAGCVL